MKVVCLFRTVSIPDNLVSVWKDTFSVYWDCNDVMKWRGDGVRYGIAVLEVSYPTPHYVEIEI